MHPTAAPLHRLQRLLVIGAGLLLVIGASTLGLDDLAEAHLGTPAMHQAE